MKKIKRSISILLIAMMALAMLGGCGNNSTSGNSTANGDSAKATEKTADAGEAKEQKAIRSSWCQSDVRLVCMVWREGHRYF